MLSDRNRRLLVRTSFVALCVVPTAVIAVVGLARRSDSAREEWRRTLSVYAGLRFTVDDVGYPRPNTVLLERVRGYDPETDALVLDCRNVEIERSGDGLGVRASQPEIYADRAARLFEALERCLRREWPDSDVSVTLAADTLTWHAAGISQTLEGFLTRLGPAESAQELLAGFSLPETATNHPVALRIRRHIGSGPPRTVVDLDTGAVVLPAAVFGPVSDKTARLGPRATFHGKMRFEHGAEGWSGTIVGDFSEVDLAALSGGVLPGMLAGTAECRVHRAHFAASRIEQAFVTVESAGGQIGQALVAAGRVQLGLGDPHAPLPVGQVAPFDALALDLRIDEDGSLAIRSRSPNPRHPILWRGSEIYWHEPLVDSQPTVNLLRVLAPDRGLLVPAERRSAALMQWLPLPQRSEPPVGAPLPGSPQDGLPMNRVPFDARLRLRGAGETQR